MMSQTGHQDWAVYQVVFSGTEPWLGAFGGFTIEYPQTPMLLCVCATKLELS